MTPYNQYTGSKPPPLWLKIGGTVAMILAMLGYVAWGCVRLVVSSQLYGGENGRD